jgi:hypothetical protein
MAGRGNDKYENFLKTEFIPSIENKKIPGHTKFQLLRKEEADEVAFTTII